MSSGKAHTGIREFVKSEENLIFDTLKEEKSWEDNFTGLNCHERNLVPFVTFSSLDILFPDLSRHLIPATCNFFLKKKLLLLFF